MRLKRKHVYGPETSLDDWPHLRGAVALRKFLRHKEYVTTIEGLACIDDIRWCRIVFFFPRHEGLRLLARETIRVAEEAAAA